MIVHTIIWTFREGYTESEKTNYSIKIKNGLEGLKGRIDGLLTAKVTIDLLESSTGDVLLYSEFENEEALKAYQVNPEHLQVAEFVRSVMGNRACIDYIV